MGVTTRLRRDEKEADIPDFDNMATMEKSGAGNQIVGLKRKNDGLF